jgi:hypothetical protein
VSWPFDQPIQRGRPDISAVRCSATTHFTHSCRGDRQIGEHRSVKRQCLRW